METFFSHLTHKNFLFQIKTFDHLATFATFNRNDRLKKTKTSPKADQSPRKRLQDSSKKTLKDRSSFRPFGQESDNRGNRNKINKSSTQRKQGKQSFVRVEKDDKQRGFDRGKYKGVPREQPQGRDRGWKLPKEAMTDPWKDRREKKKEGTKETKKEGMTAKGKKAGKTTKGKKGKESGPPTGKTKSKSETPAKSRRVAAFLGAVGWGSRRSAEEYIAAGRVQVNGSTVSLGAIAFPGDELSVDGIPVGTVKDTPPRLWKYHKPAGVEVSRTPSDRWEGLWDRLPPSLKQTLAVGRLDVFSEGLLLLTSHGPLAQTLGHPSQGLQREYRVRVFGPFSKDKLVALRNGHVYVGGVAAPPMEVRIESQTAHNAWLRVTLTQGKSRVIRETFGQLHLAVSKLRRERFGPFTLGSLPVGAWEEVNLQAYPQFLPKPLPTRSQETPTEPKEGKAKTTREPGGPKSVPMRRKKAPKERKSGPTEGPAVTALDF